ncbi:MAG: hypothetical protein K0U64_09240 [Actinomycetia bacterium]|nr:hypothetical protein [Actinomycetes bacterium]
MDLTDPLTNSVWWLCVAGAFLPGLVIALIALPIGGRLEPATDDAEARNRLIALVAAAFAFIVAFTTNTLWTQALDISTSARTVGQSTTELLQTARQVSPAFDEQARSLLKQFDQASESRDSQAGLDEGSTGVNSIMNSLSDLMTASPDSTSDTSAAFQTFHDNYLQYLLDLNAPGVPKLVGLVVILLGVVLAGVIAASPRQRTRMSTRVFLALSVFVIGLYQFPMWVLNSRELILEAVHPDLSPLDSASAPSNDGLIAAAVLLVVVISVITILLILPGLLRRRKTSDDDPGADPESSFGTDPSNDPDPAASANSGVGAGTADDRSGTRTTAGTGTGTGTDDEHSEKTSPT